MASDMTRNALGIIETVVAQHAEGAAFGWLLRDAAIYKAHYSLGNLSGLDYRVEADIDGLRMAEGSGWDVCKEVFTWKEAGEVFVAAVLAFEKGNTDRIRAVLEAGSNVLEVPRGIVSALGWLSYPQTEKFANIFFGSESVVLRHMGIAACAVHRQDPRSVLVDALGDNDFLLRARALKAVGELGRKDLLPAVVEHLGDEDQKCRFYAGWSIALLGSSAGVPVLCDVAKAGSPYSERACSMALRRMSVPDGRSWISELASDAGLHRLALIGAGALGDPASIPWIIEHMAVPGLARVAGESFSMITGVDIAYEDLEGEWPEGFEAGPTENPEDENVESDPDEDLPWPNAELVDQWWSKNKSRFGSGTRYLLGKPISAEQCQHVLRYGYQRQRAAAAIELAMLQPGQPLFEVRAPGFRQQQMLGLKTRKM